MLAAVKNRIENFTKREKKDKIIMESGRMW